MQNSSGSLAVPINKMTEIKRTICPLDCPDSCGIDATVENGKIIKLNGAKDHPITSGFICRKMQHYHHRIHSEQRILYPQKRIGQKGKGQFTRISWEEAWEILVNRLTAIQSEYGGEALLPYSYAGNMGLINRWAGYPFFHRFGASQLDHTICSAAAEAGWNRHCDGISGSPPETVVDADLVIIWGINLKVTNVHCWPFIQKALRRGAKLVVVDPYRTATAHAADYYFPVTPGGDTALALGAVKQLLENNGIDSSFIQSETENFHDLVAYLNTISWETICDQSGLDRDTIGQFANLIQAHPKTFIRIGIGLTRNSRGAMSVQGITCLAAVRGLFDGSPGKGVLLFSRGFRGDSARLTYPSLAPLPTRKINMVQLGEALTVLQPPVKALMVYSSNPLSVAPDASMVRRGLSRSDLFCIVHEQVMTPTARYADLLLPATTSFENSDLYGSYGHFYMGKVDPVLPPQGESISNFDLFQSLARRMGYTDTPFRQTIDERILDYLSTIDGISVTDPEAGTWIHSSYGKSGESLFGREEKKFQFAPLSALKEKNVARLLAATEAEDPDLRSRYPFLLITPPNTNLLNSTFGEQYPGETGTVLIHPDDAAIHGVSNGEKLTLSNGRGEVTRIATISRDTQPGLLVAEGIYWESESVTGGINDLTSQKLTDNGGGGIFHESRVSLQTDSNT